MKNKELPQDFFGDAGAGPFVLALDTGRILAVKRSSNVHQPHTWGTPGGRMDTGELPKTTAIRELTEETGYKGEIIEIHFLSPFVSNDKNFTYHNFLFTIPEEFAPVLDHENEAFQWVDIQDWPAPAHFGISETFAKEKDMALIQKIIKENVHPNAILIREEKFYLPTLYHLIHGDFEGEFINPSQANPYDPCPYVYATTNPRETLPFTTPNGTRIANEAIPGTKEILTIIPNRDDFLKNGKMQGTLLQINNTAGFEQKIVNGNPITQWFSKNPIPFSNTKVFDKIEGIESAMQSGLQILFTKEGFSAENYDQYNELYTAPDFPHNLLPLIEDGTLIHENSVRGINPSPFLLPKVQEDIPIIATQAATIKPTGL